MNLRHIISCAVSVLAVLHLALPAAAGRLHLDSGGVIEARRWWIAGDWIYYDSGAGEIGVPRSMVLRIEGQPQTAAPVDAVAKRSGPGGPGSASEPAADLRERLERANAAVRQRDFEGASRRYLALIDEHPELHVARVGYAVAEMALGRDGMALSVVLDGRARDPRHAELAEVLGDLKNREERVPEALGLWKESFKLSPTDRVREKILKAERELSAGRDFDLSATSHFNVRYDGDVDRHLASEVMTYLEEQYWELSDLFRHAPPQPITVLLYPTREFREVTQSPDWVGGIYDGKIRVPLAGLRSLTSRARGVLAHELTHAVLHSKTRGHCPQWLHEGLAQISEGKQIGPAERREVVEMLATATMRADPASWAVNAFSYPAALSLTRFLESLRGSSGLVWVLDLLGEGADLDRALKKAYGQDYDTLCRRWAESLEGERR